MKATRCLQAISLAFIATVSLARAEQGSIVGPTIGPKTMAEVMTALNAGLLAIQSCNSGSSAPANGPSGDPVHYQCWADTTSNPVVYKRYDGASWVAFGTLDTSTHTWTPYRNGSPIVAVATSGSAADLNTGTLPAERLPGPQAAALGGVQSKTCSSSNWFNALSTAGALGCSQPSFSDISGMLGASQLPSPSTTTLGGVKSKAAVLHNFLTQIGTDGSVSQAQPACADLSNAASSCSTDTTTQANVSFTGLSAAASAADADTLPVNQGSGNLKQTFAAIKTWIKGWIVKGDVGLGNVSNVDQTNASNISSGTLNTLRLPSPFTSGTASGNTTKFATTTGTLTSGNCVSLDANGNFIDAGAACAGGSGNAFTSIKIRAFTSTGAYTYTPTSGMKYAVVEVVGAGASGGNTQNTASNQVAAGGGGGAGGYARRVFSAAQIGASQSGSIGSGGTAPSANSAGNNGGSTTFGSFITCSGGTGGPLGVAVTTASVFGGAAGASCTGGDINITGTPGEDGWAIFVSGSVTLAQGGRGGYPPAYGYGGGIAMTPSGGYQPGNSGSGCGGGSSGVAGGPSTTSPFGAAGSPGCVFVTEFLQ